MTPHPGDTVTFYIRSDQRISTRTATIDRLHDDGTADLSLDLTPDDVRAGALAGFQTHVPKAGRSPASGTWKWSATQARKRMP